MARKPRNTIFPCGVGFALPMMRFRLHDRDGKTLGYSKNGQDAHLFVMLMNSHVSGSVASGCGLFFFKPLTAGSDASGRRYEIRDVFNDVLCTVDAKDVAEFIVGLVNKT